MNNETVRRIGSALDSAGIHWGHPSTKERLVKHLANIFFNMYYAAASPRYVVEQSSPVDESRITPVSNAALQEERRAREARHTMALMEPARQMDILNRIPRVQDIIATGVADQRFIHRRHNEWAYDNLHDQLTQWVMHEGSPNPDRISTERNTDANPDTFM